ncbi:molecular chaperone DnaK [Nitrospinae bacterium AH_259_B05_G02_I21]|nr:molecular chaperone DnaK [Nitrospinae bacterium AH_259_B05_G02_I21]
MSHIVGIDLGTTNSLVAYMDGRIPRVIVGPDGSKLVPSVISFEDGRPVIGERAKARRITRVKSTVYSVKRFMGKGIEDLSSDLAYLPFHISGNEQEIVRIKVAERDYTPPELSAMILRELKTRAEIFFGETVTKAVITVPAYFNDAQRQATKDAGKLAGLEVLRIVNEPTAACLAYGLQQRHDGIVAVYDLGGGTFDISILKLKDGIFEVLSTSGDTMLGGDDLDYGLMELILNEVEATGGQGLRSRAEVLERVRTAAEEAKVALSEAEETEIVIEGEGLGSDLDYRRLLTRAEFEALVGDLVQKTVRPCLQALEDARLTPEEIDEVLLVGCSTRVPMVRRTVAETFGREPHGELNPEEVVALGAAIQADILAGNNQELLLLDITPLSLGIETMGGVVSTLIPRNTTIPTRATEAFTTFLDGQVNVEIHVLQGERELARDCRSLARFTLRGIAPQPAGVPRIEVTFHIDANGILDVTARDQRSGKAQTIEVAPSYGLTEDEVERMLKDSIEHAEADLSTRLLIETRSEADTILNATARALATDEVEIPAEERSAIEEAVSRLEEAKAGLDHRRLRDEIERLNAATRPLAERIMDAALQAALKDRPFSEILDS